jgi:hypothetical protein
MRPAGAARAQQSDGAIAWEEAALVHAIAPSAWSSGASKSTLMSVSMMVT